MRSGRVRSRHVRGPSQIRGDATERGIGHGHDAIQLRRLHHCGQPCWRHLRRYYRRCGGGQIQQARFGIRRRPKLALNQTNLRTMQKWYGKESDNWIGQKIQVSVVEVLYGDQYTKKIILSPVTTAKPKRDAYSPLTEKITEALRGKWIEGKGFGKCLCPAHDDHEPSLDVAQKNGKTVFFCHAGCSQGDPLTALRGKGVCPEPPKPEAPPNGHAKAKQKIEKIYDYRAPDGELIHQVVRYDSKEFRQRRPDGKGGWVWSLKDLNRLQRHLPYRLPELLEAIAQDRPILIVEGDKDVEAARTLGIPATCNAGGAGNWTGEHSMHLRYADVVIIPDNDKAGRDH